MEIHRKKIVEDVGMDAIRRTLRVSKNDRIGNGRLNDRMGIEGTVTDDIEKK